MGPNASRSTSTVRELSEAELDAVNGGEGGVSGLFQTVAHDAVEANYNAVTLGCRKSAPMD